MAGQEETWTAAAGVILEAHTTESVDSPCKIKEKLPNGHAVVCEL